MTFDFSEFKNKKIIVTGSSTGIGFETGVEFLNLGANVIFHGNQSINDLETRIKAKSQSQKFKIFKSDFTDLSQVDNFMNNAINYLNGLDILVNNAGTMVGRYQLETISEKDFLKIFDLNAKSAYFAIKSACTIFKEQNYGNIINVSTISARTGGSAGSSVYAASKAFVSGITRSLVSELSPYCLLYTSPSPRDS